MAMTTGSSGGQTSDINVTPLIDVLLVLLIIFMVITPLTPQGLEALVPQPNTTPSNDSSTVVVQVLQSPGGEKPRYKINQEDVNLDKLGERLTSIFKSRAGRLIFVKGDPEVEFQDVAQVIDIARGTQVIDQVGLIGLFTEQRKGAGSL